MGQVFNGTCDEASEMTGWEFETGDDSDCEIYDEQKGDCKAMAERWGYDTEGFDWCHYHWKGSECEGWEECFA